MLFGSIAAAIIVAIGLVYYYGPSGYYEAKYALLAPDMLHDLRYQDVNPETGSRHFFVYEAMEFTYYDSNENRWKKSRVTEEGYRNFFQQIAGDVSVEQESSPVTDPFRSGYPASLKLLVKSEGSRSNSVIPFQEVTFAYEGDFYRMELHEESSEKKWAYFNHPGIYQKALQFLR